jgi:hypothetical protein
LDGESKLRANLTATGRALLVRRGTDAVSGASLTHPATHGITTDPERVQSKTRPACSSSSRRNHFIKTPSMFIAAGRADGYRDDGFLAGQLYQVRRNRQGKMRAGRRTPRLRQNG